MTETGAASVAQGDADDVLRRLAVQRAVLARLARDAAAWGEDFGAGLPAFLEGVSQGLTLTQADFWLARDDGMVLERLASHPAAPGEAPRIEAAQSPDYFSALAAGDWLTGEAGPATQRDAKPAAGAPGVRLDIPCRVGGRFYGVLCGEAGRFVAWSEADREFGLGAAGLLSTAAAIGHLRDAAGEALRTRQRYEQLLELFPDAVLLQGEDGVHYINPAGLRLLGARSAGQVLGLDMKHLVAPGQQELLRERMRQLKNQGGTLPPVVLKMRRFDGQPLEVEARSVRLPRGDSGLMQTIYRDLTEVRAREASLRAQELQFRTLFEMSPVPVLIQDTAAIRQVNPAGLRLLGATSAEQVVGRPSSDFVAPGSVAMVRERLRQLEAGEMLAPLEYECRRLDGGIVPVQVTSAVVEHSLAYAGGVLIQALVFDLSAQRAAEAALKASEARYRKLFEMSPYAVLLQDIEGIRYINPAGLRLLGAQSAEQIVGRSVLEFVLPQYHDEVRARARLRGREGTSLPSVEHEFRRLDGTVVPVEITSVTMESAQSPGGSSLVQTIVRDLSERRAVESALRRFNQELEDQVALRTTELARANGDLRTALSMQGAIFEATAEAIMVLDREGRPVHFNKKLLELWDVTAEDLRGADSTRLLALTRERIVRSVSRLFDDDAVLSNRSATRDVLLLRNGRYIETSASPQVLDGRVVGRVWSSRDISERVQAEQEARELNASLEERVRQRTGELAGANRELEAFSYSISHDLRAPVRAVSGFAGILKFEHGYALGSEGLALVERIQSAGERMNAMIEGLLSLARLGDRELRRLEVDLCVLARTVWQESESIDPGRDIEFLLAPGLHAVGDAVLLSTLLQNLIDNARKYSRDRAPARIEVGRRETPRGTAFFVGDNGAGFDMTHADKLFLLFSRLHSAGEFEGTGIGLATAQRIVHRHGGEIWAESSPGAGATFYFTLP